ncbi:MAG: helix-turn-helix domain-containing protein, partial [Nitriliruptoraceae bacterium]
MRGETRRVDGRRNARSVSSFPMGGNEMPQEEIEWLNTKAAARRLGITTRTLYRLIDDGKLPAYKFGRVIRLQRAEVDAFIESARI